MKDDFWNQRYAEPGFAYGLEPNLFLKEQVERLPDEAKILVPADGEGRNAIFLARQGFEVVSFDASEVGVQKARTLAEQHGLEIDARACSAQDFDFGESRYDAVALIFFHAPPEVRRYVHKQTLKCLKPNGLVLLNAFSVEQLGRESGGPKNKQMLFTEELLREDFSSCSKLTVQSYTASLNEGPYHRGEACLLSLVGSK